YDYIHIGNARPVIFFDVVRRYFEATEHQVDYVSNITDVDDKIINKAQAEGVSETEIAEKYLTQYLADCRALNVKPVRAMPKVTESMDEILTFIDALVQDDFAYEVAGDVYFRVKKASDYGKLSGKKIEDLIAGARVEANAKKEDPLDFTLWKKTDVGITWDSPWGAGRPGWHTECVVMIEEAFKGKIDIHGGGSDLQFPHHENEIAQSVCGAGHTIANTWMHVGRLGLDDEKMSKSLGNVILVKDLLETYDANVFRLFMLSTHYRQPIDFSDAVMEQAQKEWEKVASAYVGLHRYIDLADGLSEGSQNSPLLMSLATDFDAFMADDFNTANAITTLHALVKEANKLVRAKAEIGEAKKALELFEDFQNTLGFQVDVTPMSDADKQRYRSWEQARADKNFELADDLRKELMVKGLV
ncbi:MAG: cysteine--tRNA ligase, partial [Turicibacter sp.]|nr:cysteine--tRNA ligase [Turicibacter sp.]